MLLQLPNQETLSYAVHTYIVGNSGSGKSTLAKRLSSTQGMRHIDLDQYAWMETVGERRPIEDACVDLREHSQDGPTIIEGCYADLIDALINKNDRLIWLDLSVDDCIENCRTRPFEPHKWESAAKQDAFLSQLLDWLRSYDAREDAMSRPAHEKLWAKHRGETTRVTSRSMSNSIVLNPQR